jgi:hypothetical protein
MNHYYYKLYVLRQEELSVDKIAASVFTVDDTINKTFTENVSAASSINVGVISESVC